MTKQTFDVCILVVVIPAMFLLARHGREEEWMTHRWMWYSCILLLALSLHLLVYRPLVKRFFPGRKRAT